MALASAEPRTMRVDRDERDQDHIWFDDWGRFRRLHDAERPGGPWIAGAESERLGWMVEGGESDDGAHCARFFHGE